MCLVETLVFAPATRFLRYATYMVILSTILPTTVPTAMMEGI